MPQTLLVPVHLDALVLSGDRTVVGPKANFGQLPFVNSNPAEGAPVHDVRFATPFISEEIVSESFLNRNLRLKPGAHLHWALPKGLTRTTEDPNVGTERWLNVPNRWLVTRSISGGTPQAQWLVESDYIYPDQDGEGVAAGAVTFPLAESMTDRVWPWLQVGRRVVWSDSWTEPDPTGASADYLHSMTSVGYGEPTFASFYPNCHSVFGLYDNEVSDNIEGGLRYDVIGWYSQSSADELGLFVSQVTANNANATTQELAAALSEGLKLQFDWDVEGFDPETSDPSTFPQQLLCHGRIDFAVNGAPPSENSVVDSPASLAIGNTGSEALSAYLASQIDPTNKNTLERQLESLSLGSQVGQSVLDTGAKLDQARHLKQFTASPGGTRWSVVAAAGEGSASDITANLTGEVTLPDDAAEALNQLNVLQQEYDRGRAELRSAQRQVFADWYKFMLASYPQLFSVSDLPAPTGVAWFIAQRSIPILRQRNAHLGLLDPVAGVVTAAPIWTNPEASPPPETNLPPIAASDPLANQISVAVQQLLDLLTDDFCLQAGPAARFYTPNDPVVLIDSEATRPSDRYLESGLLDCPTSDLNLPVTPSSLAAVQTAVDAADTAGEIGDFTWTDQPWHPMDFGWEVEVYPIARGSNLTENDHQYREDFIDQTYQLDADGIDFDVRPLRGGITLAASFYAGSNVLSPHASTQLDLELPAYLSEQTSLMEQYPWTTPWDEMNSLEQRQAITDDISELLSWYQQQSPSPTDPIYTAMRALDLLQGSGSGQQLPVLSQSMAGFNPSLLMQKQTLQMPVADPLGFPTFQTLASQVANVVGNERHTAPLPHNDFSPIRSGAMKVMRLRIVDCYGQVKELEFDDQPFVVSQPLELPEGTNPRLAGLPPRLVQPSRMNFRWLSANHDLVEVNEHPATSPICGWLLPNIIDHGIAFYDADGRALGEVVAIENVTKWVAAPGENTAMQVADIANDHLRNIVEWLLVDRPDDPGLATHFLEAIENAFANMAPETFAQSQGLALLFGRPLAVVRASLDLQIQGGPAINESWNMFRQDLARDYRESASYTEVDFPVRVGDDHRLNDGLVGYWVEDSANEFSDTAFHAPQTLADEVGDQGLADDPNIYTHEDEAALTLDLKPSGAPHLLTMLFDPKGQIHATSGILPAKALDIPPDQYADALKNIAVTFLTAPILSSQDVVAIPLPSESGYEWSWLQNLRTGWTETASNGKIRKQDFVNQFGALVADDIWDQLETLNWITPLANDPNSANVIRKDDRNPNDPLPPVITANARAIDAILLRSYIATPSREATFAGQQLLREGWLKLTPVSHDED